MVRTPTYVLALYEFLQFFDTKLLKYVRPLHAYLVLLDLKRCLKKLQNMKNVMLKNVFRKQGRDLVEMTDSYTFSGGGGGHIA